jgi:hypothetical protein
VGLLSRRTSSEQTGIPIGGYEFRQLLDTPLCPGAGLFELPGQTLHHVGLLLLESSQAFLVDIDRKLVFARRRW